MNTSKSSNDWQTYNRLFGYVRSRIWYFGIAILAFGLASLAEVFFTLILGSVVDSFQLMQESIDTQSESRSTSLGSSTGKWYWLPDYFLIYLNWHVALVFAFMIGLAATIRAFGNVSGTFLLSRVSYHVVHTIRCELHEHMLALPSKYFDASRQGDLSNRLTDTVAKLRETATDVSKTLFQEGAKLVFYLSAMLFINFWLTLLFIVLAPIIAIVVRVTSKRFRKISVNIQESMGEVTHVGQETVLLQQTIRSYNAQEHQHRNFCRSSELNRRQHLKMIATKALSAQFIQLLVAVAIATLVGFLLFFEHFSLSMASGGVLVAYIGLAGMLANPIKMLSDVNARIQMGLAAATEIFTQIDLDKELDQGSEMLVNPKGSIQFQRVHFGYSSVSERVISDVSLSVQAGQTVAIVGSTGAGKSTLMQLLLRFYEPDEGTILINDKSIATIRKNSLRAHIAVVSQDVVLFSDTIRANIAFGPFEDKSDDEIQQAARRARVTVFSDRLPNGLDTHVGDRGSNLSQGEKQRILIARAILKNSPILVLDEATSSLDAESEELIQSALDDMMQGRTTLVIAHRLSTVRQADSIVVLEKGRIVEQGTHRELINAGGRYALLYQSQFKNSEAV